MWGYWNLAQAAVDIEVAAAARPLADGGLDLRSGHGRVVASQTGFNHAFRRLEQVEDGQASVRLILHVFTLTDPAPAEVETATGYPRPPADVGGVPLLPGWGGRGPSVGRMIPGAGPSASNRRPARPSAYSIRNR